MSETLEPITNYAELLNVMPGKWTSRQVWDAMVAGGMTSGTWDDYLTKMEAENEKASQAACS